jgi:hypothetical protein
MFRNLQDEGRAAEATGSLNSAASEGTAENAASRDVASVVSSSAAAFDGSELSSSSSPTLTQTPPLRSPAMARESRETVTALLRKPSEELTLDDIEFLLNCVRKAPALALQPPFTKPGNEEEVAAQVSAQDGVNEAMDDQSD